MSILRFINIYDAFQNDDSLLEKLDLAEATAVEEDREGSRKLQELGELMSVSEQHHKLKFVVPAGVDLEHVQALIMYGFLMPGQDKAYIGGKVLPERHVRTNVKNKLGIRYDLTMYGGALQYLKKEGVLNQQSSGSREEALSLKSGSDAKTRIHGEQILRVSLEYERVSRRKQ